jgi:microcystin degradation protein MlrC
MPRTPIRIAVLYFCHETVSFLPNDTTLEDFVYPGSPASGEAMLAWDETSYLGGFVQVAREHEAVGLVGITSPYWPKTGTGSGWVTNEAYDHFVGAMIAELRALGPFDGVYLALHGAMAVRGVPRPEAELARRVREVVGRGAAIAATFDPHGNEDAAFLEQADMAFTVKYFPHYDCHLQGERAARMLIRAIRGDYAPATLTRKIPIISPTVLQWTGASPWMDLVQRALTWEAREPDAYVNLFFGFPWADVPDGGMTVQVMTNGNPALAHAIAADMAGAVWRQRARLLASATIHGMEQGMALAQAAVAEGRGPVVLADHSDRSGRATWLLSEVITRDGANTLIGTVADGALVQALVAGGVKPGDAFDHEVGGNDAGGAVDPSAGGKVRITGTVRGVHHDVGGRKGIGAGSGQSWITVGFGRGNVLVLSPYLAQIIEPDSFHAIGIDPAAFDIIALKSRVHFRRGFDDSGFAKTIVLVEPAEPFLGTIRLDALPYRNLDLAGFYPYGAPEFAAVE